MRYSKILAVNFSLALLITGCNQNNAIDKTPKNIASENKTPVALVETLVFDISSPDKAVKSWWKFIDLAEKSTNAECEKQRAQPLEYLTNLPKIAQEETLKALSPSPFPCIEDIYEREIQEVKIETETRAIVFAKLKNITPIPEGATPDEYDVRFRSEGERAKYLLEKSAEGWKISQVYKFDKYASRLNRDTWEKTYKPKTTPQYPSIVYKL